MRTLMSFSTFNSYLIEPGDATCYRFGFYDLSGMGKIESGIGNGDNYVMLVINMGATNGCYSVSKDSLQNVYPGFVRYIASHLGKADMYTVCAVLLALGVLIQDSLNIELAAKEMLRASDILYGEMKDEDD